MWRCLLVILALSSGLQAYEITKVSPEALEQYFLREDLGNVIWAGCWRNGDLYNSFRELQEATFNYGSCMKGIIENLNIIREPTEDITNMICSKSGKDIYKCLDNFLEKAEPCLDVEDKDFPELIRTANNASFEQFCSESTDSINATFPALQHANCARLVQSLQDVRFGERILKLDDLKALRISGYVLSKTSLPCRDVEFVHERASEETKPRCNDYKILFGYIEKIFDSFLTLCKGNVAAQ